MSLFSSLPTRSVASATLSDTRAHPADASDRSTALCRYAIDDTVGDWSGAHAQVEALASSEGGARKLSSVVSVKGAPTPAADDKAKKRKQGGDGQGQGDKKKKPKRDSHGGGSGGGAGKKGKK